VYPISNSIFKEVFDCKDIFTINMAWQDASRCYWTVTTEAAFEVYAGRVILRHQEWLESIKTWRTIQSVLRIRIKFQRFVSVDTTTSVYNEQNLRSAITQQVVSIERTDPARVEIVTLLSWPYKLDSAVNKWGLGTVPNNPDSSPKYSSITYGTTDCTVTQGKDCRQRWNQLFFLNDKTCTLTGQYALNYTLTCGPGISTTDCPLTQKDKPVAIVYTLTSEDFCATVEVDIGLVASMMSYEDATFTTVRSAFTVGRDAFFKIVVTSDVNTVTFSASAVQEVQFLVKADGKTAASISIYKKGVTADCTKTFCNFKIINRIDVKESAFSFNVSTNLIDLSAEAAAGSPALKQNSKITFTLNAVVQVSYLDTAVSKKRFLMGVLAEPAASQSGGSSSYDMSIPDANFNTGTGTGSGSTSDTSSASFIVVSLLSLIIAFFF